MTRQQEQQERGTERTVVVGLLCDPDLAEHVSTRLSQDLPAELATQVSDDVSWDVRVACEPFETVTTESGRMIDKARQRVKRTEWDLAICVTDLPLWSRGRALAASVVHDAKVALVSLPALGAIGLIRRARKLVAPLVDYLVTDVLPAPGNGQTQWLPGYVARGRDPEDEVDLELVAKRGSDSRLVAGMVRANHPWMLTAGLSLALAAGMAGSAFGVLYSNIWQLAAALGPARLAGAAAASFLIMVTYLILGHSLWERRPVSAPELGQRLAPFNVATTLTVSIGVLAFFGALITINLAAVALVVPPDYLASTLGRPVGGLDYLTLALMASCMGTVAGAVGSGLENDATVRMAAYSSREQQRRARMHPEEEDTTRSS